MTAAAPWFAVFGQPVAHSRSPRIHQAFAAQRGLTLRYERIECPPGGLADLLRELRAQGLAGANVTMPLKSEAWAHCGRLSLRADRAAAVNTLVPLDDGEWFGDNTDGAGLVQDLLARQLVSIAGRRLLLIGAGGAAAGVLPALLDQAPAGVTIVNRTAERARTLADRHGVAAIAWSQLSQAGRFELLVHASASGHAADRLSLPDSLIDRDHWSCAIDLSYGPAARPFLDWAAAAGVRQRVDGLGMLVEQAALAFAQWHGVRPLTEPVYQLLRQDLPL